MQLLLLEVLLESSRMFQNFVENSTIPKILENKVSENSRRIYKVLEVSRYF
jgi:hypothetical protein